MDDKIRHHKPKLEFMTTRRYPIGIQTFERIRKEGLVYIDKTELIYRMAHQSSTYCFLSRPRRFGKSLLVSTLKSYFEGRKDLPKRLGRLKKKYLAFVLTILYISSVLST